jgi:hypothetical protein
MAVKNAVMKNKMAAMSRKREICKMIVGSMSGLPKTLHEQMQSAKCQSRQINIPEKL